MAKSTDDISIIEAHNDQVLGIAVDGGMLLSSSRDSTVRIWDLATGDPIATLEGHKDAVESIAVSGGKLVSGSWDRTVGIWDLERKALERTLKTGQERVHMVLIAGRKAVKWLFGRFHQLWNDGLMIRLEQIMPLSEFSNGLLQHGTIGRGWQRMKTITIVLAAFAMALMATARPSMAKSVVAAPIVYDGMLLGGSMGGEWVSASEQVDFLQGGETYRWYDLTGAGEQGVGSRPVSHGEPCPDALRIDVIDNPDVPWPTPKTIAMGGYWNAMPRIPRIEGVSQKTYRLAAAALLREQGVQNPKVVLKQVIRVDLEGDGVDEVLVAATHFKDGGPGFGVRAGEYSMVFLRKFHKGKVEARVLQGDFNSKSDPHAAPNAYEVTAILDLNGDGTMEVVIDIENYEGSGVLVHEIEGLKSTVALSGGCGA